MFNFKRVRQLELDNIQLQAELLSAHSRAAAAEATVRLLEPLLEKEVKAKENAVDLLCFGLKGVNVYKQEEPKKEEPAAAAPANLLDWVKQAQKEEDEAFRLAQQTKLAAILDARRDDAIPAQEARHTEAEASD